jgi:riboflavin biosynthesis pyrimidine reductase
MRAMGNAWTRSLFDGGFHLSRIPDTRPACSLVFVQSADGNTGAKNPSELGGGETDKHLIYEGLSRVAADAVLAGAETIRGGHIVFSVWHPELVALRTSLGKPRHPRQIIATLRGLDLTNALLFNVPGIPVFVVTTKVWADSMQAEFAARPWITPIVMPDAGALRGALEQLRASGIERISCVGGRSVATQLIDAHLVDDVYLTTSPKPGGEQGTPMYSKPLGMDVIVRKQGRAKEAGVIFEHLTNRLP